MARVASPEISTRPSLACPACRGAMDDPRRCGACGRDYPAVAGMADLRLKPDRYLSLAEERAKAHHLARIAGDMDLPALSRAYYAITGDVGADGRRRFLRHIAAAEERGRVLARLLPKSGRVLEVGCGTGGLLAAASRRGVEIEGVDIAARWLVLARKRLEGRGRDVSLWIADAARLPWPDGMFAAVVADSLIEHMDDPLAALAEWLRVARPGGQLVLWSPNRYSLLPDPHTGLWGLGFLPRSIQGRYVKLRKSSDWRLRTVGSREALRRVREAGWVGARVEPAPGPSDHLAVRMYDHARRWPFLRSILRTFGPLWQITARKGAA